MDGEEKDEQETDRLHRVLHCLQLPRPGCRAASQRCQTQQFYAPLTVHIGEESRYVRG